MTNNQFSECPAVLGQSPVKACCPRVIIYGTISVS